MNIELRVSVLEGPKVGVFTRVWGCAGKRGRPGGRGREAVILGKSSVPNCPKTVNIYPPY